MSRPIAIAMVVVASFLLAVPASATGTRRPNFATALSGRCHYSDENYCTADSLTHDWDWDLGPRFAAATFDSLYNTYDTTDLVVAPSGHVNDGAHSGSVDVYLHYGSVAGGWALTSCQDDPDVSHHCDHFHIIDDSDELVAADDNDIFFKKVACHELGHSVGVAHPYVEDHDVDRDSDFFGCMRKGDIRYPNLGGHGAHHIDDYYPF